METGIGVLNNPEMCFRIREMLTFAEDAEKHYLLLVYSQHITPRLIYTLDIVLKDHLNIAYRIVLNREEYSGLSEPGINYSDMPLRKKNEFRIKPAGLLFRDDLKHLVPEVKIKDGIPLLFPVDETPDFPFDLFSAVFYLVSRYEEYLPFHPDRYGRFPASQSMAQQKGFLEIPVVDIWCRLLGERLRGKMPGLHIGESTYRFLPTIDVDQAFSFCYKPLFRRIGGKFRSLSGGGRKMPVPDRKACKEKNDPFYTFPQLWDMHAKYEVKALFFFHTGRWGKYDKSVPVRKKIMKDLIKTCAKKGYAGLHPSFRAYGHQRRLRKEKTRLDKILGKPVFQSRQHYIRFSLPETYRHLISAGIHEDYSMGFADNPGFRTGTARPFRWFDITRNETTDLFVYPFAVMDGVLKDKMHMTPVEAIEYLKRLIDTIRQNGGWWIPVWHNHSISDDNEWRGWTDVYEQMLEMSIL